MSFGKKILEKYGYKEGLGLGKNEDGITDAIKAKFKFDQKGFGSGELKEETNHWWERTFNEASNNINVNSTDGESIKIDLKDKDGVEITNKSYSLKKLKESNNTLQYGKFLKAATLDGKAEEEIAGHIKTEDIEIKPIQVLTDEELLKACEYRTAHKGARHGLRLNGKLQRIADQEKALLERMKAGRNDIFKTMQPQPSRAGKVAIKRPLQDLNSSREDPSSEDELPINLERKPGSPVNKTKSKKQRKRLNGLANQIESIKIELSSSTSAISDKLKPVHVDTPVRKSKKESKKKNKLVEIIEAVQESESKKKKKKTKKRLLVSDDETMKESEAAPSPAADSPEKKFKCARLNDSNDEEDEEMDVVDKINKIHHQKSSRRHVPIATGNLESLNIDNSVKKSKKKKSKKEPKNLADDSWEVQSRKKLEKYEKKKLKYQVMQQKLLEKEARAGNKSKKKRKKEAKKKLETITNVFDSVEL